MAFSNANRRGNDDATARQDVGSGKNKTPNSRSLAYSQWYSIFAGEVCVGHIISRGRLGWSGFDADDRSLGIWETVQQAADAVAERVGGRPMRTEIIPAASTAVSTPKSSFDYSTLDADAAELAKRTVERFRQHQRRTIEEMIAIGSELTKVKVALGYGQFGEWLEAEFGWSERTARNYMSAAVAFKEKSATVADLPPAIVYKLAAPSVPEPVRNDILRRLDSGEDIIAADIQNIVEDALDRERAAKAEAKLTDKQRKARARRQQRHKQDREEWARQREVEEEAEERALRGQAEELLRALGRDRAALVVEAKAAVIDALRRLLAERSS